MAVYQLQNILVSAQDNALDRPGALAVQSQMGDRANQVIRFESLFFEKISQKIAETRGLGIGKALYRQLSAKISESEDRGHAVGEAIESFQRNKNL